MKAILGALAAACMMVGGCGGPVGNALLETQAKQAIPRIVGDAYTAQDIIIPDPQAATVLIYSHGTKRPYNYDNCEATGYGAPDIVTELDGEAVHVVRHCSRAIEEFTSEDAGNQVYRKAAELTRLALAYAAQGVDPRRIFIVGHSNGGWSGMMAYARAPDVFGGVIAFAPAFAGKRAERWVLPWWGNRVRPAQVAELSAAPRLSALVFAYEGDPFNRPEDLAFLPAAHPEGVIFKAFECPGDRFPHSAFRRGCGEVETVEMMRAFIDGA